MNSASWQELKSKLKIPSLEELDSLCISGLQCSRPDGSSNFLRLAPAEFYVADMLVELLHSRFTGLSGDRPSIPAPVLHWIDSSVSRFIDPDNLLYAIRPGDSIWQRRARTTLSNTPDLVNRLLSLVEAVAVLGSPDCNRVDQEVVDGEPSATKYQQHRVDIQCIGQDFNGEPGVEGPSKVTGKQFLNSVESDSRWQDRGIKELVGDLCFFAWMLMDDLEKEITGLPLAPDKKRNDEFAKYLREHLGIYEPMFNAESVTIVVGILYPNKNGCGEHEDKKNDTLPGYSKTGVLNLCLMDEDKTIAIHVQVRKLLTSSLNFFFFQHHD